MLKILLALTVLCAVPAVTEAKTYQVGADAPAAAIAIPDSWDSSAADGGVEALSPDKGLYLSAQMVDSEDLKEAGRETASALAAQKITLKADTRTTKPITVAGMAGVEIGWDATDADGPTQVHLTVIKITASKALLLMRWGSADQEKSHAAEIAGIVKSIAPIK